MLAWAAARFHRAEGLEVLAGQPQGTDGERLDRALGLSAVENGCRNADLAAKSRLVRSTAGVADDRPTRLVAGWVGSWSSSVLLGQSLETCRVSPGPSPCCGSVPPAALLAMAPLGCGISSS